MKKEKYYLAAAENLCMYLYDVAEQHIDYEKLDAYVDRLSKKIFKTKHKKRGLVKQGISQKLSNIYTINDNYFAGAEYLLQWLVIKSIENGFDIEVEFSPYFNENVIENIAIPELNIAFLTNSFLSPTESEQKINFSRFYTKFDKSLNLRHTQLQILNIFSSF